MKYALIGFGRVSLITFVVLSRKKGRKIGEDVVKWGMEYIDLRKAGGEDLKEMCRQVVRLIKGQIEGLTGVCRIATAKYGQHINEREKTPLELKCMDGSLEATGFSIWRNKRLSINGAE